MAKRLAFWADKMEPWESVSMLQLWQTVPHAEELRRPLCHLDV